MIAVVSIDMLNSILDIGSSPSGATDLIRADVSAQLADATVRKAMARAVIRAAGDSGATEDIVQDALVKCIRYAGTFDWSKGTVISWACRIAANEARNWRKASANNGHESEITVHDERVQLVDTLTGSDGRHDTARDSEYRALAVAMGELDSDAQTFLEAMAGGMGQCDAGRLLGWSPATTTRRWQAIAAAIASKL